MSTIPQTDALSAVQKVLTSGRVPDFKTFGEAVALAQSVLQVPDEFWGAIGQSGFKNWASSVMQGKRNGWSDTDPNALDMAKFWSDHIGDTIDRYNETKAQAQQKVDNAVSNAKNLMAGVDTGKITDPAEIQRLKDASQKQLSSVQGFLDNATLFGLNTTGQVYQDASGNWLPGSAPENQTQIQPTGGPINLASAGQSQTPMNIPFKTGLSSAQQQSIRQLATKDPSTWSATDKANWAYATNNASIPSAAQLATQGATGGTTGSQAGLSIYRVGSDIYDAATGRKLGPTEFASTYAGKATEVAAPSTGAGTPATSSPSKSDLINNLHALGITDDMIAKMSPADQANFAAIGAYISKQMDAGNPVPQMLTAKDLADIAQKAQNDPEIAQYYKDQLRVGTADLTQQMAFYTGDYTDTITAQQQQFKDQQKQAALDAAAAGQAYSGFREQAKQKLGTQQQAVLSSTIRQAQQNLQGLGGTFEKTFGSAATPSLTLPGYQMGVGGTLTPTTPIAYTPIGGVQGTMAASKAADIATKAQSLTQTAEQARGLIA